MEYIYTLIAIAAIWGIVIVGLKVVEQREKLP